MTPDNNNNEFIQVQPLHHVESLASLNDRVERKKEQQQKKKKKKKKNQSGSRDNKEDLEPKDRRKIGRYVNNSDDKHIDYRA